MENTQQIKEKAFYLIAKTITLKANVFNGCPSSREDLEINLKRMPAVKLWFKKNNEVEGLKYYLSTCSPIFQANEIADLLF